MYKKGAGNDKQGKDAGNRTLCPYRNFSQAIKGVNKSSYLMLNHQTAPLALSCNLRICYKSFQDQSKTIFNVTSTSLI